MPKKRTQWVSRRSQRLKRTRTRTRKRRLTKRILQKRSTKRPTKRILQKRSTKRPTKRPTKRILQKRSTKRPTKRTQKKLQYNGGGHLYRATDDPDLSYNENAKGILFFVKAEADEDGEWTRDTYGEHRSTYLYDEVEDIPEGAVIDSSNLQALLTEFYDHLNVSLSDPASKYFYEGDGIPASGEPWMRSNEGDVWRRYTDDKGIDIEFFDTFRNWYNETKDSTLVKLDIPPEEGAGAAKGEVVYFKMSDGTMDQHLPRLQKVAHIAMPITSPAHKKSRSRSPMAGRNLFGNFDGSDGSDGSDDSDD